MNCKQGDIAMIVVSPEGVNLGILVEVIAPYVKQVGELNPNDWAGDFPWFVRSLGRPIKYYGVLRSAAEGPVADSRLRPIRPEPGQDETLSWAGLPQEVTA